MAAATQAARTLFNLGGGELMLRITVSVMTSDQIETISYNYADLPAQAPARAYMRIKTAPTNRCLIGMECDLTAANTTNKTVPARFYTEAGGDISGAVVDLTLLFTPAGTVTTGTLLAA